MKKFRDIFLHAGVICSLICITAKILDWYNPYMDFTGHIQMIQVILYVSVIILAVTKRYFPDSTPEGCSF